MHTPEYNEPFTYDEVWQWMEEVYMWTGIPPTVAEITNFCHVGTEGINWAIRKKEQYEQG